jgi:hypothetical protein
MPGHSGLVWMALLVTAHEVIASRGAASATALLSALMAVSIGIGDKGLLDTLLSYTIPGVAVDLTIAATSHRSAALSYALAGGAGNLAKLAVKVLLETWIGIPTGFALIGRGLPVVTHFVFGLAGGWLGALATGAARRASASTSLLEKR